MGIRDRYNHAVVNILQETERITQTWSFSSTVLSFKKKSEMRDIVITTLNIFYWLLCIFSPYSQYVIGKKTEYSNQCSKKGIDISYALTYRFAICKRSCNSCERRIRRKIHVKETIERCVINQDCKQTWGKRNRLYIFVGQKTVRLSDKTWV